MCLKPDQLHVVLRPSHHPPHPVLCQPPWLLPLCCVLCCACHILCCALNTAHHIPCHISRLGCCALCCALCCTCHSMCCISRLGCCALCCPLYITSHILCRIKGFEGFSLDSSSCADLTTSVAEPAAVLTWPYMLAVAPSTAALAALAALAVAPCRSEAVAVITCFMLTQLHLTHLAARFPLLRWPCLLLSWPLL